MPRPPLPVGGHGKITAQRLAKGRFVARCRYRGDDGVTVKVEAAGTSGADATRNLEAALARRVADADDTITGATRVAVVVAAWLADVEASDRSTGTKFLYAKTARLHVVPQVGSLMVRECSVPRLDRVLQATAREVGPATAKLVRTVLTGALSLAVRHGALVANPMREVAVPRSKRQEVRAPSPADVLALRADMAADPRAAAVDLPVLLDVLAGTGARIGEALALRWCDVDLDAGTVALTGTVVRVTDRVAGTSVLVRQDTTKGHRPRALLVPTFTLASLRAQHERHLPGGEHGLVLPSAVGGLREVATVERQWRAFRGRHPRWEGITPHSIRRAVATVVERSSDLATAAAVLGHSSSQVTAKHYVERAILGPDVRTALSAFSA